MCGWFGFVLNAGARACERNERPVSIGHWVGRRGRGRSHGNLRQRVLLHVVNVGAKLGGVAVGGERRKVRGERHELSISAQGGHAEDSWQRHSRKRSAPREIPPHSWPFARLCVLADRTEHSSRERQRCW